MRDCPRPIVRPHHHDQETVVSVPDYPLPKICMNGRATQPISLPRPSNGLSLLWLTSFLALVAVFLALVAVFLALVAVFLALVAVFLAFLSPLAALWYQSAKATASLANFGNELQHFANQTTLLAGRPRRIER